MFKKCSVLFTSAILGLAVSMSALAIPPEVVYQENQDDVMFPAYFCGDFMIMANADARVWITNFYDKDGEVVRQTIHQSLTNTVFFNSENPDIMWEAGNSSSGFGEYRYENGSVIEWRLRGMNWHIQDRGEKIAFTAGFQHCTIDGCSMSGLNVFPVDAESHEKLCDFFAE